MVRPLHLKINRYKKMRKNMSYDINVIDLSFSAPPQLSHPPLFLPLHFWGLLTSSHLLQWIVNLPAKNSHWPNLQTWNLWMGCGGESSGVSNKMRRSVWLAQGLGKSRSLKMCLTMHQWGLLLKWLREVAFLCSFGDGYYEPPALPPGA